MNLPSDFVLFWRALVDRFHGNVAASRRVLIQEWKSGRSIPGYGSRVDWSMRYLTSDQRSLVIRGETEGLPPGWSYENLQRALPSKAERAINRPWNKGFIEHQFRALAVAGL